MKIGRRRLVVERDGKECFCFQDSYKCRYNIIPLGIAGLKIWRTHEAGSTKQSFWKSRWLQSLGVGVL